MSGGDGTGAGDGAECSRPDIELAVIGGGNMGAALVHGLLTTGWTTAERIVVVEVAEQRRAALAELLPGVATTDHIPAAAGVLVAVKPDVAASVVTEAARAGARRVLSIAAGVPLAVLDAAANPSPDVSSGSIGVDSAHGGAERRAGVHADGDGDGARDGTVAVVRAMPNTPALVGHGAAAIAAGAFANDDDLAWAEGILAAVGTVVRVAEDDLDAVTGLSGSGPAYVFLLAEALIDAGVAAGLTREIADGLVRQLLVGSAALLAQGDDPAELRRRVTSPNGTTAAGIAVMEQRGFRDLIDATVRAAANRSVELRSGS